MPKTTIWSNMKFVAFLYGFIPFVFMNWMFTSDGIELAVVRLWLFDYFVDVSLFALVYTFVVALGVYYIDFNLYGLMKRSGWCPKCHSYRGKYPKCPNCNGYYVPEEFWGVETL